MSRIRERVSTSFYLRHVFAHQLRNIEDGTVIVYYSNPKGSQWFEKLEDVEKWLNREEELRLDNEKTDRPNTKWVFEAFFNVDLKVVLDRKPLVGTGPLPDWLRNLAHSREWYLWTCITTTCAYGGASLCTEGRAQTVAQKKPEVSSRVSKNSRPLQKTSQKLLLMSWKRSKPI